MPDRRYVSTRIICSSLKIHPGITRVQRFSLVSMVNRASSLHRPGAAS